MLARRVTQGLRMAEGGGEGGTGAYEMIGCAKHTVREVPAICSHSRDVFLSPSLLGCLDPLLVLSPNWSCFESSV